MKKLIVLMLVVSMSLGLHAQNYIGIKAGGGISQLSSNGYFDHFPGTNIVTGLAYKMKIFTRVMLEADVLLDMRSTVVEDYLINEQFTLSSQYLQIPLSIHWIVPFKKSELIPYRTGQPNAYWYLEAGPHFSYGLSVDSYLDPIAVDVDSVELSVNAIDVGVMGGIGLNFGLNENKQRLSVGARATYGLLNVNTYENAPTFTHFTFIGFVGLDFNLSRRKYYHYRM